MGRPFREVFSMDLGGNAAVLQEGGAFHASRPEPGPCYPPRRVVMGNTSRVHAAWPSFHYPATFAQVHTWKDMPGVSFRPDSGSGLPGLYWYPTFMDPTNATRSYARTGHWNSVWRHNYHLLTKAKVNKILLRGTKAYGIQFTTSLSDGLTTTSIRANKEVILAAGAIHSPQIMQLSGLGPKRLLESANITVVVDLPGVGQNFQDHLSLSANFTCTYSPWYDFFCLLSQSPLRVESLIDAYCQISTWTSTRLSTALLKTRPFVLGRTRSGRRTGRVRILWLAATSDPGFPSQSSHPGLVKYPPACYPRTTAPSCRPEPTPPSSQGIDPKWPQWRYRCGRITLHSSTCRSAGGPPPRSSQTSTR